MGVTNKKAKTLQIDVNLEQQPQPISALVHADGEPNEAVDGVLDLGYESEFFRLREPVDHREQVIREVLEFLAQDKLV